MCDRNTAEGNSDGDHFKEGTSRFHKIGRNQEEAAGSRVVV